MAATAAPPRAVDPRAKPSELIKALNHSIRRSILRYLLENGAASSTQIRSVIPGVVGNNLNFHLDILVTSAVVTKEKRVGYRENFYVLTQTVPPWALAALQVTAGED